MTIDKNKLSVVLSVFLITQLSYANQTTSEQSEASTNEPVILSNSIINLKQGITPNHLPTPHQIEQKLNRLHTQSLIQESYFADLDLLSDGQIATIDTALDESPNISIDASPDINFNNTPTLSYTPDNSIQSAAPEDKEPSRPNFVRRLYNRILRDGLNISPKLKAQIYTTIPQTDTSTPSWAKANAQRYDEVLVDMTTPWQNPEHEVQEPIDAPKKRANIKQEPFANIKKAIESISEDTLADTHSGIPELLQLVHDAAAAVGYYDIDFYIRTLGGREVEVVINDLGEPVVIMDKIIDIQGAGEDFLDFVEAKTNANQQLTGTFHHGNYEDAKASIETVSAKKGFFEGAWLDNSVDVILPDNTADVSLIYNTGARYGFDEVVFFTIDPDTGELTADPDKLPVNLSLLQKLVDFEVGQGFDATKVNKLTNDLMATRYFNTSNVEAVLPSANNSPVEFVAENATTTINTTDETGEMVSVQIAPIDFSASENLRQKINQVVAKANRLYNSPDNRVLDETTRKSTSILGRISDGIKDIVQKILPDESSDHPNSIENITQIPILANKKTPTEVASSKKIPLYVFVEANKPHDAEIGLGWGSDIGTRLMARYDANLINKKGHQAGIQTAISKNNRDINAYFAMPLTHPINDKLLANIRYTQDRLKQVNNNPIDTTIIEASIARNILSAGDWQQSYSLRYRQDRLDTELPPHLWGDLPVRFNVGSPAQNALLAGVSLSKIAQNNPQNPTAGYRQSYALEAGSKSLVGETNMIIAKTNLSGMYSFGDNAYGKNRQHQFIAKANLGYIWADSFIDTPYKLRFFAGGDNSLRGYDYQSLSPVNSKGYLTGGQALAVGSLEYNYEFRQGMRAAIFSDFGNAYNKDFSNDTKIGAGLGIRWASPVGTVRVDIAKGIEKQKTPIKLHFLIGVPF